MTFEPIGRVPALRQTRGRLFLVLLSCAAVLSVGCGTQPDGVVCAAYATAGLGVTVSDALTGQALCDASVTASEGGYSESLVAVGCVYTGAYERPGTYVVRASRPGFAPAERAAVQVVMGGGDCPHVEQTRVTLPLSPAP